MTSQFFRQRVLMARPPLFAVLIMAAGFVLVPTLLRAAIDSLDPHSPFVTYYPAITICAVVLGWRWTVGVAILSTAAANYWFIEPRYTLFAGPADTLSAFFFLLSVGFVIAIAEALRLAAADAESGRLRELDLNSELHHLNSELQHRCKNTLAITQAIATHTFRGTPEMICAARTFAARLHALGAANDVLTGSEQGACELPRLAARTLEPFREQGAIQMNGPHCILPASASIPFALALHELGTNAIKYGALSRESGSIDIVWNVQPMPNGKGELVLNWTERGGPTVNLPTRRGLGSRLLSAQRGLDRVSMDYRPDGLSCCIAIGGAVCDTPKEGVGDLQH